MGDYKIKMNIDIESIKNNDTNTQLQMDVDISEEEACSIDCMEKILLSMDKEILKKAISQHFENVSKKKSKERMGI